MGESALNARSAEALFFFVSTGDNALNEKIVEALLFMNMGDVVLNAKSSEALLFVNIGEYALDAKNAEAVLFVRRRCTCKECGSFSACERGRQHSQFN